MAASSAPAAAQNPLKTLRKASFLRPCRLRMVSLARPPPISALASSPSTAAAASPLSADTGHRDDVLRAARDALSNCLSETYLDRTVPGLSSKARGKVRDIYDAEDHLVLVTTDRQSAFDRVLASIPFKGQVFLPVSINSDVLDMVLNETSLWWFNKTQHITPNAVVSAPDSNGLQYHIVPLGTLDIYQFDRGPVCLEFLRLWFKEHCNPYKDEVYCVLPEAPEDLVCELAWRYIFFYSNQDSSLIFS
ncbi:hypothetical protein B296_00049716 [Ensete ventricosum]|uniref:phosphoribosylaminoimidazolesuccinocarboxamide synthase n=1 Tax=Ensete ventricosum TaxID=4639 RepID=A0A426YPM1_ENSVE|nr:hypothetical protein B296_00049716 [Ensete ventricosum]